jgi:hypothetical protein
MPENLYIKLEGHNYEDKAERLLHQWNTSTEWIPKRGERVLVWDDDSESQAIDRIFLSVLDIENLNYPICVVVERNEFQYLNGDKFSLQRYSHMKQLPKEEEPIIEKGFKEKVIELVENKLSEAEANLVLANGLKDYHAMFLWDCEITLKKVFLKQIKELK